MTSPRGTPASVSVTVTTTAKADGEISASIPFQVNEQLASSIVKITLVTAGSNRDHDLYFSVLSGSTELFLIQFDVKDNATAVEYGTGTYGVLLLHPGSYTLNCSTDSYLGFQPSENVSITLELLGIDTDLAAVSDAVLSNAAGSSNTPVVGFGLSEDFATALADTVHWGMTITVGDKAPYLSMSIFPDDLAIRFDVVN